MKPDINISLLFDIVEGHCEISDFTALRQLFASRLMSFFAMHPEVPLFFFFVSIVSSLLLKLCKIIHYGGHA